MNIEKISSAIINQEYKRLARIMWGHNKVREVVENNSHPMLLTKKEIELEKFIAIGLWGKK